MPDAASNDNILPPPSANGENAERYVKWLTELIDKEKVLVAHSDLTKFSVDCLMDHYRVNLKNYDIEVSHSKTPDNGEDMYVMLFNNLKNYAADQSQRAILSFIHLTSDQFSRFRASAENQLNLIKKRIEEKRFKEAMAPVDSELSTFSNVTTSVVDQAVKEAFPTPNQSISNNQPINTQATTPTNGISPDAPAATPNLVKPPLPDDIVAAPTVQPSPTTDQPAVSPTTATI